MGQIGYVLAQALSSAGCPTAPLLCQVVVDSQHEAFRDPSKFVGPIYGAKEATALSQSLGWVMKPDGEVSWIVVIVVKCWIYIVSNLQKLLKCWIGIALLIYLHVYFVCVCKRGQLTLCLLCILLLHLWFLTNSILEELCRVLHHKSKLEFVIIKICCLLLFC